MKNKFSKFFAAAVLGLLALTWLTPPSADAQQSFNITNCLAQGVSVVGWPTNTVSATTGLPMGTGGALGIPNDDLVGFWFSCLSVTNTNGCNVVFTLMRSPVDNPPGVTYGTNIFSLNVTNLQASDWETPTWGTGPILITVPISNLTNAPFNWYTNLPAWQVSKAKWLGIYAVTNSTTASCFLTNVSVGLSKKILPIRYP